MAEDAGGPAPAAAPHNVVVVLLDSLNRHLLGSYGGDEFATPNLDRLAARSVRFERHHVGSLPCMPARHDLLVGSLDFLWRPWGSIELWEEAITCGLRRKGVKTMLVSDHPHLFETGGENYHCDFSAWEYLRGHESDPWRTRPDGSDIGAPSHGRGVMHYDVSRTWFRGEEDFPGPRTLSHAAQWLARDATAHRDAGERFLLVVDEFDPHEPFDTPDPWATMYDPDWEGPHLIWPPYSTAALGSGTLTERELQQLRACYGAKLSMTDHWFGKMLDAMDAGGLWDSTAFVLLTDHGHYLGEKDLTGKPGVPPYQTLAHIPLLVAWPGAEPRTCDALTTTVDVHATLCDVFDVTPSHRVHGRSIAPLVTGAAGTIREHALMGVYGREVTVLADDGTKYVRGPGEDNLPLSMFSNRWSTMPITRAPDFRLPLPDDRAYLDRMPGSAVPVIRQPFQPGDLYPYWALRTAAPTRLFRVDEDPREDEDHAGRGTALEKEAVDRLRAALDEIEAPKEQLERLGVA